MVVNGEMVPLSITHHPNEPPFGQTGVFDPGEAARCCNTQEFFDHLHVDFRLDKQSVDRNAVKCLCRMVVKGLKIPPYFWNMMIVKLPESVDFESSAPYLHKPVLHVVVVLAFFM
jgi:hypothetical protein